MAAPTSFSDLLTKYCRKLKPKRILEWGPGVSTQLMLKETEALIVTVENIPKWYNHWKERLDLNRVMLVLLEDYDDYTQPLLKSTYPKFDLIFVDGRERVRCLKYAKDMINKDGVVILHDSERPEYKEGIDIYDIVEMGDGTVCLKLK